MSDSNTAKVNAAFKGAIGGMFAKVKKIQTGAAVPA
jgi:hypothetical protein|tara:strand:- start:197 stop:304 length:108 start_codon:yes stop_codon:yes gene_type:complete